GLRYRGVLLLSTDRRCQIGQSIARGKAGTRPVWVGNDVQPRRKGKFIRWSAHRSGGADRFGRAVPAAQSRLLVSRIRPDLAGGPDRPRCVALREETHITGVPLSQHCWPNNPGHNRRAFAHRQPAWSRLGPYVAGHSFNNRSDQADGTRLPGRWTAGTADWR